MWSWVWEKGGIQRGSGVLGSVSERVELLFPRWGSQEEEAAWFGSGGGHGRRFMHNESEMLETLGPGGGTQVRKAKECEVGENEEGRLQKEE